jgi:hypothetical protein
MSKLLVRSPTFTGTPLLVYSNGLGCLQRCDAWGMNMTVGLSLGRSALIAAALALATTGVASATPSVVGMTYDKAQAAAKGAGVATEVSTTTGTELAQGDCIVVNQVMRAAVTFGQQNTPSKMLLSLNCNAPLASAGHPGNSAGSPEGQAAKKEQLKQQWLATPQGQAWCVQAQRQHPDWFPQEGCPSE